MIIGVSLHGAEQLTPTSFYTSPMATSTISWANTEFPKPFEAPHCADCRDLSALGFDFTMAYQPILNIRSGKLFAYEALVRGPQGQSAASVLGQVNDSNRYRFDQACRVKAIEIAARLGLHHIPDCRLSINFLPNAVYRPASCIRSTLEACSEYGFPSNRLMFEVTEGERVNDDGHLLSIFKEYRSKGFTTAIDDFGAGYAGLRLLTMFQPHVIKIDMDLVRDIDSSVSKHAIVSGIALTAERLGILLLAEGIETAAERDTLLDLGIELQQGYLYARPAVEQLPLLPI